MTSTSPNRLAACFAAIGLLAGSVSSAAPGDVLFSDDLSSGAGWGVNATSDTVATFGYDYSAMGIPEAPNSELGDTATTGFKAEANLTEGAAHFLTAYPVGQSFTGDYQLRFDAWINFADLTSTSTEFIGGGIGYDGVTTDVASGAQLIATGDGGSSNDWRAFKSPPQFFIPDADMIAGDHNGFVDYYADFLPAVAPPAAQGQDPTALSTPGSPGFQWITFEFSAIDGVVEALIEKSDGERLPIVTIDCNDTSDGSAGCPTDGNISLFYADFFTSLGDTTLQFGVFDNVVVTEIPEPATTALVVLGSIGLLVRRR